jgi:hypothetical protein
MRLLHVCALWMSIAVAAVRAQDPAARPGADAPLEAGLAVIDITPPVPYRMSGYFNERLSTGVKDPLQAKALVFRQGELQAALVLCDLVGMSPEVVRRARARIEQNCGVPPSRVSIAATHSHTGPLYFGALREHWHRKRIAAEGADSYERIDYPAQLEETLVAVVEQARQRLRPVVLRRGAATETRLSFNRRFHMRDGSVRFNPGQLNPDIVRPAGPIDPQVGLLSLQFAGEPRPAAVLVNFALHLDTVGGTLYSADYPRHLEDRLRAIHGPDFVSLFGAGACGDINHIDVTIRGRRSAEEIGALLAETVEAGLSELAPIARPSLAVAHRVVDVPLQRYTADEIAEARRQIQRVDDPQLPFLDRVRAYKILAVELRGSDTLPLEVHAFRLDDETAIVTLPGEVFVELGLAIKQGSPFDNTLVIELANDAPGYLPTQKAFVEGSYETVNSRAMPGSGEQLVAAALELLRQLAVMP